MKSKYVLTALMAVVSLFASISVCLALPAGGPSPGSSYRITGPFNSDNLNVYLIHGQDRIKGQKILTLQEALEQKQLVVQETGNVNDLRADNRSDAIVFIQSGDIIKGGRQDRTIQFDMLLPPKSGLTPLPVFCVEQGRWSQRGGESAALFSAAPKAMVGKELKIAARAKGVQQDVWQRVAEQQAKLSSNVGASVQSPVSESSLQLTLENKNVQAATNQHRQRLARILEGQADVVGYAFAINGQINSADVYASHELFTKLWPKLIESSAVESIAEKQKGKSFDAPSIAVVDRFLNDAEKAPKKDKIASKVSRMTEQESRSSYLFKTEWSGAPAGLKVTDDGPVVHTNYLAK